MAQAPFATGELVWLHGRQVTFHHYYYGETAAVLLADGHLPHVVALAALSREPPEPPEPHQASAVPVPRVAEAPRVRRRLLKVRNRCLRDGRRVATQDPRPAVEHARP